MMYFGTQIECFIFVWMTDSLYIHNWFKKSTEKKKTVEITLENWKSISKYIIK